MKRFPNTLVAAMIIAATGAAIMVGCKKEESAQMKDGAAQTEQSMSPTEQKVLDFLSDYDAMKRGAKVDGESVTPELLRHLCETTVNYCHGFTQSYLTDVRNDIVYIPINLYNQDWYYKTEIRAGHRGGEEDPCVSIYHIVDIWHAVRRWRVDNSGTYPTPIDNEL